MKTVLKVILFVLLALVLVVGGYVAYVFIDYYRLEDNLPIMISDGQARSAQNSTVPLEEELSIVSYNIGFGAYSDDYSFFMDGGKYSRAFSEEAVLENINGAIDEIKAQNPDFILVQEADVDATRSYHVNERYMVTEAFSEYSYAYAQNYDSPYLFYPISEPHGKNKAGIITLSRYRVESGLRRSLPIEDSFMKLVDLDRCYSVCRLPLDTGKTLCLYNLHLSAYSSDGSIAVEQLKILFEDMQAEYAAGNYVVCGGDFNKDILGNSPEVFGISGEDYTWAQPFPFELLPQGFSLVAPLDEENPVPSARNADAPYDKQTQFQLTIDGFIVSDNVAVSSSTVIDAGFKWSDHNPVKMVFSLKQ